MFLFLKLILAHLIADFMLQFEELYRLKVKSWLGHFYHAAIHAAVSLLLTLPYLKNPWMVLYILALAVIHYYQDLVKYSLQHRDPKNTFWYFTLDQIIHVAWLATAFLIPGSGQSPLTSTSSLARLYSDNYWTAYPVLFIAVTFNGTYWLHSLRKSFFKNTRPDHLITSFEVGHALLERSWMTAWILFAPLPIALPASLVIGLARFGFRPLRNLTDFLLSWGYAASVTLLFRSWIHSL